MIIQTQMEIEALQAPLVLAEQMRANQALLSSLARRLRESPPYLAMTIARGSSDHAATFAKYVLETRAGIITTSAFPSVFTLYQKKLPLKNCLVIAISQSGASLDVAEMLSAARLQGAITVAFVNECDSTLANAAEYVVPLGAGPEKAVAATKTYLATLGALIQFTAILTEDDALQKKLLQLPEALSQASTMDWSQALVSLQTRNNALVVARGYGLPIAQEAALKMKETAKLHAEAFSGAELLHGPFALVEKNFPLLLFAQQDQTLPSMLEIATRMKALGATVLLALASHPEQHLTDVASILLPLPPALHPICDPLLIIQAFYKMIARLSLARGFNPDAPDNLSKVTMTW